MKLKSAVAFYVAKTHTIHLIVMKSSASSVTSAVTKPETAQKRISLHVINVDTPVTKQKDV